MAKKGKKAKKEEHPLTSKLAVLGMSALTAFATGVGTEAAARLHPPPSTTVIIETQQDPPHEWERKYNDAWTNPHAGNAPEEQFHITLIGDKGLKEEFVIRSEPRHLTLPQVPTLQPPDHPAAPHLVIKSEVSGVPEGYAFKADKAHMLEFFSQNYNLDPKVEDALKTVTEIKIARVNEALRKFTETITAKAEDPDKPQDK